MYGLSLWRSKNGNREWYKWIINACWRYCATRPYLSVVEVRPRLGARVSVARIRVNERLRLLDFSLQNYPKGMKPVKINLFYALSQLYSKPVTEDDDTLDYIPTQYIAEFVKRIGYDGIVFKSSLYNDENSVNHCPASSGM